MTSNPKTPPLPVAVDPDEFWKIKQAMLNFPSMYTDEEKEAYGIRATVPHPANGLEVR